MDLKRQAFVSTLSLFFQSGYSAVLGFVANLILTILLSPSVFGIYILTLSIISFLNYFSDVGLAASLIQKKNLEEEDVKTVFTAQQIIIIALITIGFLATSFVKNFYKLPQEGVYLYWALLISFFLSSLKTIPSVFLERKIQFQKIVFVQVVENTIFYVAVSVLALLGFGLHSFTTAVILRSFVGLVLIYSLSFWMPRVGISLKHLRQLLTFGVPYQASSYLAIFKDDLVMLFLGKALGFEGLGLIGFAKKWAEAPIRIIMDNVTKIVFPLIARFQDNTKMLKRLSERILYYQTALIAPAIVGIVLVMDKLIDAIPNYQKWQPALPLFYVFALSSLVISFSAPFMNLFNALGKVKKTFSFMFSFTVLIWILTPSLTSLFGVFGFPISHLIVSIAFFSVLLSAKRLLNFHFLNPVYKFLLAAVGMAVLVYLFGVFLAFDPPTSIFAMVLAGLILYPVFLQFVFKINIISEIKSFYEQV